MEMPDSCHSHIQDTHTHMPMTLSSCGLFMNQPIAFVIKVCHIKRWHNWESLLYVKHAAAAAAAQRRSKRAD